MIATVRHIITGNEPIELGETVVYFYPASGYKIIDVIINGLSMDFSALTIDEETGKVAGAGLSIGDWMACTYKTLPRNNIQAAATMVDFSETDFENADFT
jgi:hypothetical protein